MPKRIPARKSQTSGKSKSAAKRTPVELPIRAHVMLRGELPCQTPGRSSLIPQPVDAKVLEQTRLILEQHGFHITGSSPVGITIEAAPAQFQEVFGAKVRSRHQPHSAAAQHESLPAKVWRFEGAVQIPPDLRPLVQDVVFPAASVLHG